MVIAFRLMEALKAIIGKFFSIDARKALAWLEHRNTSS
jgi:hypothetical protein